MAITRKMSVCFQIEGYGGRRSKGRGVVNDIVGDHTVIVRLTSDDLGGFGTYRRGIEVRISPYEIIETERN